MQQRFEWQSDLGQTPIEDVPIPLKSRDELPSVLPGLQWIFQTPEVNEQVFQLLEQKIIGTKKSTGPAWDGSLASLGTGRRTVSLGLWL